MEEDKRTEENKPEENIEKEAERKVEAQERNATLEDEAPPSMTADELQESILEDSGMNAFQKFCARMDDRRWSRAQRITGALLGLIAGISLFWDTLVRTTPTQQQGIFSLPLVIAIVVALIVPNIIEKQGQRRAPKLRTTMVIALALVIVVYFLVIGARTGFKFAS